MLWSGAADLRHPADGVLDRMTQPPGIVGMISNVVAPEELAINAFLDTDSCHQLDHVLLRLEVVFESDAEGPRIAAREGHAPHDDGGRTALAKIVGMERER